MKEIDNNLLAIFNSMIKNKGDWMYVTDEQKKEFCFIINRFFSKKYLRQSEVLNNKNADKVLIMDLWYYFMLDKPYPKWFWSKSSKSDKDIIPAKDFRLLISKLKLKPDDIYYLIDNHPDFIKEELAFYKKVEKGN